MKRSAPLALLIWVLCSCLAHAQQPLGDLAIGGSGAKNLRFPVGDPSAPTALVNVGEVKLERRQVGPLSLGLLQKPVLQDVTVEISGNPQTSKWWQDLGLFFAAEPLVAAAVVSRLSIQTAGRQRKITAAQGQYSHSRKSLQLSEVTLFEAEQSPRFLARAELPLGEPGVDRPILRIDNNNEKVLQLFPEQ